MARVPYNSVFQKDGKTLTTYGFMCGYVQTTYKKKERFKDHYKEIYMEHAHYHVKLVGPCGWKIWETFEGLSEARKFYNSLKLSEYAR